MEIKLTKEKINDLFTYLNKQPYALSAPLFEFFYTIMQEQGAEKTKETIINNDPVDEPTVPTIKKSLKKIKA